MDHLTRMKKEMLYISDDSVFEVQKRARRLTQKFNTMDRSDFDGLREVIRDLIPESENAFINPPFYCDYGDRIRLGKDVFINYNCTILDTGIVRIGDCAQIAPNVSIYTAGHPVHPAARNTLYEYGIGVTIGNNVWIGGNTVICPGVTIGDNCVIGAGSVVTKDIPAWSVAAGNPCRVLRQITEDDREVYYRGIPADPEALDHMRRIWADSGDRDRYPVRDDSEDRRDLL